MSALRAINPRVGFIFLFGIIFFLFFYYYPLSCIIITISSLSLLGYFKLECIIVSSIRKNSINKYQETQNPLAFKPFINAVSKKTWLKYLLANHYKNQHGRELNSFLLIHLVNKKDLINDKSQSLIELICRLYIIENSKDNWEYADDYMIRFISKNKHLIKILIDNDVKNFSPFWERICSNFEEKFD